MLNIIHVIIIHVIIIHVIIIHVKYYSCNYFPPDFNLRNKKSKTGWPKKFSWPQLPLCYVVGFGTLRPSQTNYVKIYT